MHRRHFLAMTAGAALAPGHLWRGEAPGQTTRRVLRAAAVTLEDRGGATAWAIDGAVPSPTPRFLMANILVQE